jgi:hypothetical protein
MNNRKLLITDTANMPKNVAKADSCFKAAVGFIRKYPIMILPQAMKLADFFCGGANMLCQAHGPPLPIE